MARPKSVNDKQREFLAGVSREALADWVAALAKELPDVQRRLDLFAARNSDAESAAATYRAAILTLTKSRNRNPQKRAREARTNFENMVKSLTADFQAGRLALVLDVVPEVLLALDVFLRDHADPQAKVREMLPKLTELHLEAATELRPGGERLAEQLARVAREGWAAGLFREAAYSYRDVLGDEGLARYRELIEPDWRAAVGPAGRRSWQLRSQVEGQMMAWARALESPAMRAAETAKILRGLAVSAEDFLEAAESFARAGDADAAKEALEAGFLLATSQRVAPGTLLALASSLMESADPAKAETLAWTTYTIQPSRDSYSMLQQAGAGTGRTAELKEQAMTLARARSADLELDLLLADGRFEDAAAVVKAGRLSENGWALWASEMETIAPAESMSAWFRVADIQVAQPGETGRESAIRSVQRARRLAGVEQFTAEWSAFCERHRRRGMMMNQIRAALE